MEKARDAAKRFLSDANQKAQIQAAMLNTQAHAAIPQRTLNGMMKKPLFLFSACQPPNETEPEDQTAHHLQKEFRIRMLDVRPTNEENRSS